MLNSVLACVSTICVADNSSNSFKIFCQKICFVTGLARRGKHSLSVRYEDMTVWMGAPIAACKYANLFPFSGQRSRDPFDQGSFTGSPGSNVTDTNDRPVESGGTKRTSAVERQPCSRDSSIQRTQWWKYDGSHDVRAFEGELVAVCSEKSGESNSMVLSAAP